MLPPGVFHELFTLRIVRDQRQAFDRGGGKKGERAEAPLVSLSRSNGSDTLQLLETPLAMEKFRESRVAGVFSRVFVSIRETLSRKRLRSGFVPRSSVSRADKRQLLRPASRPTIGCFFETASKR